MFPITRRGFMAATACACITPSLQPTHAAAPSGPVARLALWPGAPPGGGGPTRPLAMTPTGTLSSVNTPLLDVYQPAHPNGTAILIAPGGGYERLVMQKEGHIAAKWLNSLGITAFVLTYRLPDEGWHAHSLAPFQDAQRALRLIKANAAQYGLTSNRIGLLGFSAGGHLMGMLATRPDWQTYTPVDALDVLPLTVSLALLAYPIITLAPPYDTTQTRRHLVGEHPALAEALAWSVQTYVTDRSPPFFLVQAADDPIANAANTAILQQACLLHHVPVTRYLFEKGGHGFGVHYPKHGTPWPILAETWLKSEQFLPE